MGLTRPRAHQLQGSDYKQSVRALSSTNITLSGGAPATVDGVSVVAGDRILVTGQTDASENGLYKVDTAGSGSNGTWSRTQDGDSAGDITAGMTVMVTEGTSNADTQWKLITDDPITIGTTDLEFEQASAYSFGKISVGGTTLVADKVNDTVTISAGNNISLSGNASSDTFTIATDSAVTTDTNTQTLQNKTLRAPIFESGSNSPEFLETRYVNATQQDFVQLYTGASSGSYFTNGEYQKIATIIPSGNSQNYTFIIRLVATSASNYQIVTFTGALRSNTLPDLTFTVQYNEEHNGTRFIEPKLWTKETTTAGFIIAFEYIHTDNLYGGVNVDATIIPRSDSLRDNVTFNTTQDSEQSSVDSGYTENDPTLVFSQVNGVLEFGTQFRIEGSTVDGNELTITATDPTADRTITFPDATGTVALTSDITGISNVVEDTTPQLGGDLDLNSNDITGTGNINATGTITASGNVTGGNLTATSGLSLGGTAVTATAAELNFTDGMFDNTTANAVPSINASNNGFVDSGMIYNSATTSLGIGVASAANIEARLHIVGTGTPNSGETMFKVNNSNDHDRIEFIDEGISSNMPSALRNINATLGLGIISESGAVKLYSGGNTTSDIAIEASNAGVQFSGAYRFPTSDGDANQVLQTDGSGTLTFVDQSGLDNIVEDTTPQLGGDLDLNSNDITGTGNVNITGTGTFTTMTDGTVSFSSGNISGVNELRINQNGSGLRMTNVGAFDNDTNDNFRIFSTANLIFSSNGSENTRLTITGGGDVLFADGTIDVDIASHDGTNGLKLGGTLVTSSATELNLLNGITGITLGDANESLIVDTDGNSITTTDLLAFDTANNRVGIGTTSPATKLHVAGEGSANEGQIRLQQANDGGDGPDFAFYQSRGTIAAPTSTANSDTQGRVNVFTHDGTDFVRSGGFGWNSDGTDGDNRFNIQTRVSGTTADRINITAAGDIEFQDGAFDIDILSHDGTNGLKLGGTLVTASATELNLLDGVTGTLVTTAGSQTLTNKTLTSPNINEAVALTATATELNLLDGVTGITLGSANELLVVGTDGSSIASDSTLAVDTANNRLGINQTSPEVTLHMTGEGAQTAQIRMEQHNDNADAPDIRTRKSRGTADSSTKNNAGDFIYRQNHERYNGTDYVTVGQLAVDTDGTNADRFKMTFTVSEDGTSIDAANNQILIDGADSGAITFNQAYKFPTSDGTANQVLQTDGSGNLTFATVSTSAIDNVVEDTTPQLGGDLDLNSSDITGTGNINATGTITASGNITGGNLVTTGTVTLDRLSLSSSQTTVPPLQLTANSLNDGVGALRIDSVEPDIFLNDTDGGFATITFSAPNDGGIGRVAIGRDNNNDFYLTVRDPDTNGGNWRNDTFVADSSTGDVSFGYDLTVSGDATVTGNLTVNGTTTTVSSTNTVITDNLIELNNGAASNANDSGIVIERGSTGDNAFMGWDESADSFILGTTTATGASTGDLSITAAPLSISSLTLGGTAVTSTATELNLLDGVTGTLVTESGTQTLTNKSISGAQINSGTIPDARIQSSGVTQHQANLSITESQISDLGSYITASSSDTLTNKSIAATQLTGTIADARIANTSITQHQADLSITESQISDLGSYITASSTDTLTNKSIAATQLTGTIADARIANTSITQHQSDITSVGNLTGLTVAGNVLPSANVTYNLGSDSARWNELFLAGSTITLGALKLKDSGANTFQVLHSDGVTPLHIDSASVDAANIGNISATQITSGTIPDARIQSSGVTQHQADLSITESQISDLGSYITASSTDTLTNKSIAATQLTGTIADARIANTSITQHQADLSITESQISDLQTYLTSASDLNADNLSSGTVPSGRLSGSYSISVDSATTSGTVTTAAQPNITSVGTLTSITTSGNVEVQGQNQVRFFDSNSSHYVSLRSAGNVSANVTWTLPTSDGSDGQVLTTNGGGTLSFEDAGGGASGSSYPNSTISFVPGLNGDYDLSKTPAQTTSETPFESGVTDAFGVNLGSVFDAMDPIGSIETADEDGLDLGELT